MSVIEDTPSVAAHAHATPMHVDALTVAAAAAAAPTTAASLNDNSMTSSTTNAAATSRSRSVLHKRHSGAHADAADAVDGEQSQLVAAKRPRPSPVAVPSDSSTSPNIAAAAAAAASNAEPQGVAALQSAAVAAPDDVTRSAHTDANVKSEPADAPTAALYETNASTNAEDAIAATPADDGEPNGDALPSANANQLVSTTQHAEPTEDEEVALLARFAMCFPRFTIAKISHDFPTVTLVVASIVRTRSA
jgi:hypothetical protein